MRMIHSRSNINISLRAINKSNVELFINTILIISIYLFIFLKLNNFSKIKPLNNKYNFISDKSSNNTDLFNKKFRDLTTIYHGKYTKEDFINKTQIKYIIDQLSKNKYEGKWFTKPSEEKKLLIGKSLSGLTKIDFIKAITKYSKEPPIALLIYNYEDNFINSWLKHTSLIQIKELNLIIEKENNSFIIKGKFYTDLEYGEYFEIKKISRYPCFSNIILTFPIKNATYSINAVNKENYNFTFNTIDERKFNLDIYSCGFNNSMELILKEDNDKISSIGYVISIGIINILNMISYCFMINNLKNNKETVKCIPLFYLIFNINWHFYCSIRHMYWSFSYPQYFFEFITIACFYVFNIIFFEMRFSCTFWNAIQDQMSNRRFIQKKFIFYISFYFFPFFSYYLLSDILIYYYPTIIILGFLTWTPQIIYNIIYNNKHIYPIIYIISSTLDKLFFAFYFRGYNKNFFRIRGNKTSIAFLSAYILLNILILFFQYLKGPRFFLGKLYKKNEFEFYKTKKELIALINDLEKLECAICLTSILETKNEIENNEAIGVEIDNDNIDTKDNLDTNININKEIENNINNKSINSSKNHIIINNDIKFGKSNTNKIDNKNIKIKNLKIKRKKNKMNKICKINSNNFLNRLQPFYKFRKIVKKKNAEYMITPCNHVFHRECLEKWLLLKQECPYCRNFFNDIIP